MKKFISVLLCLIVVLTACGNQPGTQDETGKAGNEDMDNIVMTEEEIQLMCGAYGAEERIQQGKLFDYQVSGLKQLRAGLSYLEEKYPGTDFEILTFAPANKFNPQAKLLIRGEGEQTYSLTVEPQDDTYLCLDNCYSLWLKDQYDAYVTALLQANGISGCAYSTLTELVGIGIGPETSVEEFIAYTPKIDRTTDVYLLAPGDLDAEAQKIQNIIREAGLYGSYYVHAVPSEEFGSAEEMDQNRKSGSDWKRVSFNCFDI